MCGGILLWVIGCAVAASMGETAGNVYIWGSLIVGGLVLWEKTESERKARAQAVERKEQAEVYTEVARWQRESREQQGEPAVLRPTPATVEPPGSGMTHIDLVEIALPSRPTLELPDPEQARQLCADVVAGLVRSVAAEAESHAAALRPLAAIGCRAGRYRSQDGRENWGPVQQGQRLTPEAADAVHRAVAWAKARRTLLSALHAQAVAEMRTILARTSTLQRWRDAYDTAYEPPGTPVRPAGEWGEFLQGLADDLAATACRLRALPLSEPPPRLSPTGAARLREDTVAEAVEDRIFEYVEKHARRLLAAPLDGFSMTAADWDAGARLLKAFLTAEIPQRFARTTEGFQVVSQWDDTSAAPGVRSRMHRIFVTFALNYMVEVLKSMPEYVDPGENPQKNGIIIQGGVVQIANTLNVIGSNVAAVMQRGDTQSAEAVNALSAAVQADPDLDPQSRAEQLENVADVAAAVADPDTDGSRRRGRNALAAITAAAGASSQITQAIEQWQHVFTSLG